MLATVLEARDLTKSYAGPPLFSRLHLRVEAGLVAVTGANGSGKTTLLKILAALQRPSSGTVRLQRGGRELSSEEGRLAVGWAGPDLSFYEDLTAFENLRFFRLAAGLEAQDQALHARLADVGLAGAAGQRVGAFSTGMNQRLRIAFALLCDPPILLLDEPMAALDAEGRAMVERVVSNRSRRGAVVLASNDPRDFFSPNQIVELGQNRSTEEGRRKPKMQGQEREGDVSSPVYGLPSAGLLSLARRAWAICAKDAAQEFRRRIATASVFFFAVTSLTLVSFAIGPFGLPPDARDRVCAALLWILLFFSTATGLPRAFVREEETGTALALRKVASALPVLVGKALFNFVLFLAIAAVTVPGFSVLLEWKVRSLGALAAILFLAGYGLSLVSTFLAALVARASQKSVLFVVVSFPLLAPLLLSAIAATVEASHGNLAVLPLRVIVAYDGAASCAAYLLAAAAWED